MSGTMAAIQALRARVLVWLGRAPAARSAPRAAPLGLAHAPLDVLAAKIAFGHARNRQQLLGPPPTAFGHLDAAETELLIQAAALAAVAPGTPDEAGERKLRRALLSVGLQVDGRDLLGQAMRQPPALDVLVRQVRDPHRASLFYAASLLAADRHDPAAQAWLQFLATRLRVPDDTRARLHSQFGVARPEAMEDGADQAAGPDNSRTAS